MWLVPVWDQPQAGFSVVQTVSAEPVSLVGQGDSAFDENAAASKGFPGQGRLVVNDDDNQFEFSENQDFSIELYLNREEVLGAASWGVLAGPWHRRHLAKDCPDGPEMFWDFLSFAIR